MSIDDILGNEKERIKEKVKEQFKGLLTDEEIEKLSSRIAEKLSEEGFGEEDISGSIERMLGAVMTLTVGVEMIRMVQEIMSATYKITITGSTVLVPVDIQASSVMMPVEIRASTVTMPVSIEAATAEVNINIARATVPLAVDIIDSDIMMPSDIQGATIMIPSDIQGATIMIPSDLQGATIMVPVDIQDQLQPLQVISPKIHNTAVTVEQDNVEGGTEVEVANILGEGEFISMSGAVFMVSGNQSYTLNSTIEFYVDGESEPSFVLTLRDILILGGNILIQKIFEATSEEEYEAQLVNQSGGFTYAKYSTDTQVSKLTFVLNIRVTFTTGLIVKFVTYGTATDLYSIKIVCVYGTY